MKPAHPAPSRWRVQDVCRAVEELAPPALAYAWDRSGLAVGSPSAEVSSVLFALTLTDEVVDAARRANAEMIVLHHPPIWEPLKSIRYDDPLTRPLLALVRLKTACYSAHTNLDLAEGGVNDALAERLGLAVRGPLIAAPHAGLRKLVAFVPESHLDAVRDAVCAAGAATIGAYTRCTFSAPGVGTFQPGAGAQPYAGEVGRLCEEPERRFETLVPAARIDAAVDALLRTHPYEEAAYDVYTVEGTDPAVGLGRLGVLPRPVALAAFAEQVKTALKTPHVRYVGPPDRSVQCVGVIGGSGGSELAHVPEGVDVVVTGDVKYHDASDACCRGLAVVDAGHAATELPVLEVLERCVQRALPGLGAACYEEPELFQTT